MKTLILAQSKDYLYFGRTTNLKELSKSMGQEFEIIERRERLLDCCADAITRAIWTPWRAFAGITNLYGNKTCSVFHRCTATENAFYGFLANDQAELFTYCDN